MPAFFRVNIDGTLAQGAERWSTAVAVSDPVVGVPPTPANMAAAAESILQAFAPATGWPSVMKGGISSSGSITRVRVYWYADVGQAASVQGVSVGAPIAGEGTATLPPQCTVVISLRTGLPGRSQRGRMYWPLAGGAITVAQRSAYVTQTFANSAASMLNAIRTTTQFGGGDVVIASEKTGQLTKVNAVTADNVVDTQRRRRDKLTGTAYFASL